MTSVERVVEYTELKSEAPWVTSTRPPGDWPSRGQVTFDRVHLAYRVDGPLILKDINAVFRPNEKVRPFSHRVDSETGKVTLVGVALVRWALWGGREPGKALWWRLCFVWRSHKGTSTSTAS